MKLICQCCAKKYESCPTCEGSNYFAWRNFYCSRECFYKAMRGEIENMRLQIEGKIWNVKEYDLEKGEFKTLINNKEVLVKEDDENLEGFLINVKQYNEIKDFKQPIKKRTKKESVDEVVEEEE